MGEHGMNWTQLKQPEYREAIKEKNKTETHIEDRSTECVGCQ